MTIRYGLDGKLLVHCHAGCSQAALLDALRSRGLLDRPAAKSTYPTPTKFDAGAKARAIWQSATPIANTPAETYLRARAIGVALPPTLRFAADMYHTEAGQLLPALIAGVAVWPSQSITAVQRIYLRADGTAKADATPAKKSLGPIRGGAVRLGNVGKRLGIVEGVEDALSVTQLDPLLPMWAALGASNLKNIVLPELPLASEITIVADNDKNGVGIREANAAADLFVKQGRNVRISRPPARYKDFNEALQSERPRPETLTDEQRYDFEERAAIGEHDGGLSRAGAESQAWNTVVSRVANTLQGAV